MNELKIKVNFKLGLCVVKGIKLITGDYNSTKILFDFDDEEGTKIFEMKDPEGNLVFLSEIMNDELLLSGTDSEGKTISLFNKKGNYVFEISLYKNDSKLTSASNVLQVVEEQVVIDDKMVTNYLPLFDKLLNEINSLNITSEKVGKVTTITITKKDGTTETAEILDGDDYVITDEDYEEIETNVKTDIQPILDEAKQNSETAVSISKGANQSKGFKSYQDLVTAFNVLPSDTYRVGQNLYIKTKLVPDLWVYEVFENSIPYTYTNDEEFVQLVESEDGIRIGYYSLGPLETQKVDLTDYQKKSELDKKELLITYEDATTENVKLVVYK